MLWAPRLSSKCYLSISCCHQRETLWYRATLEFSPAMVNLGVRSHQIIQDKEKQSPAIAPHKVYSSVKPIDIPKAQCIHWGKAGSVTWRCHSLSQSPPHPEELHTELQRFDNTKLQNCALSLSAQAGVNLCRGAELLKIKCFWGAGLSSGSRSENKDFSFQQQGRESETGTIASFFSSGLFIPV